MNTSIVRFHIQKKRIACSAMALFIALFLAACSGRGNVDLSKATPLTAEPVASGPAAGLDPNGPVATHSLFNLSPGQWTSFQVLGGVIDPVGTVIEQDFDGDGINNSLEKTSNIWVADYPVIESQIAPPVTMRIEVLKTDKSDSTTINTDLTSDNFESRKNEGSEKFHQDEVNVKTINNGSTTDSSSQSSSSTSTKDVKASAGGSFFGIGASVSGGASSSSSSSSSSSNTTVRQTFEDRPFVNNVDRAALSTKADAAEKKARDYRAEKRKQSGLHYETKSDGGIIRAALYIKNLSVNMPVRLSNILCSLVFEAPNGSLIPIQSFRLRNDDFSLFEAEIYGGSEFGPYVITLPNLNTVEIENALAYGYTPKIFIVDYKMTHVQDSNYRLSLGSNFVGDNLKIIEENAKGRTALLKIMYPNYRNMFRIVAFDTKLKQNTNDICNGDNIDVSAPTNVSPGIAMDKFLDRLKCSGIEIEYGHYIYDFTGTQQAVTYPKVYTYTVKSVNGRSVSAPCTSTMDGTGFNPQTRQYAAVTGVCVIKIKDLTEEQLNSLSIWATFNNGKYFKSGDVAKFSGNYVSFDGVSLSGCGKAGQPCGIPVLKGLNSYVWAGDNYDLVYLRMSDYLSRLEKFGVNPLETGANLTFNTAWSAKDVGEFPWYPQVRSTYLGKAGVGDTIEIKIKLNDTTYLGPNFGTSTQDSLGGLVFTDFKYDTRKETSKLFNVREAIDFELNLGLGGERSDWVNLIRGTIDGSAADDVKVTNCGQSWNFLQQEYTFCLILPAAPPGVGSDKVVNLYMRTSLNNAYRKTIWPQDWRKIRKFDSTLKSIGTSTATNSTIQVDNVIGLAADIASGNAITVGTNSSSYTISGQPVETPAGSGIYSITITPAFLADEEHKTGERVYVRASSTEVPGPQISYRIDNGFETAWNSTTSSVDPASGLGMLLTAAYAGSGCASNTTFRANHCLGYNQDLQTSNWLGYEAFNNGVNNDAQNFSLEKIGNVLMQGVTSSTNYISRRYFYFARPQTGYSLAPTDPSLISSTFVPAGLSEMVSFGDQALIVWVGTDYSTYQVRGRIVDVSTGLPTGSDFAISPPLAGNYAAVAVANSGSTAIVVWSTDGANSDIFGQIVNISTGDVGNPVGSNPFSVSLNNNGSQTGPRVAVAGNSALIVWQSNDNGSNLDIRGRTMDLTSLVGGSDFLISNTNSAVQMSPQIANADNKALVVWQSNDNGSDFDIRGRFVDISSGVTTNSDFLVSNTIAYNQSNARISVSENRALVVWESFEGTIRQARGKVFDLAMGTALNNDFNLSTDIASTGAFLLNVSTAGNIGMVVWVGNSDMNIYGRVVDLKAGEPVGYNVLTISTNNTNTQLSPDVKLSGNRALIAWTSNHLSGSDFDVRGRVFDAYAMKFADDSDFLVSKTNQANQTDIQIDLAGNRPLIRWLSADIAPITFRSRVLYFDLSTVDRPGFSITQNAPYNLNNFFTAPLIERNFTATTKIVK